MGLTKHVFLFFLHQYRSSLLKLPIMCQAVLQECAQMSVFEPVGVLDYILYPFLYFQKD